jgi:hypothetical protein
MNPSYVHFRPTSARAALEVILGEGILSELVDETNECWRTALLPFELAEFPDVGSTTTDASTRVYRGCERDAGRRSQQLLGTGGGRRGLFRGGHDERRLDRC